MPRVVVSIPAASRSSRSVLAPSHRHEQVRAAKNPPVPGFDLDGAGFAADPGDHGALGDVDALGGKAVAHHLDHLGIVLTQNLGSFDHRNGAAQTPMRLCHLHADGAAADDEQVAGPLAQPENRLVRLVRHRVETGDRRHQGRRAGGDDHAPRGDEVIARLHLGGRDESAILADHPHAQALEPCLTVHRRDLRDDARHMILGGGVIDLRDHIGHAILRGMGLRMGRLAAGDQRLGGDAAEIEAVAAHPVTFEQDDAGAHLHSPRGDGQPARASPDDQQIRFQLLHVQISLFPRMALIAIGSAASAASPRIGPMICGSHRRERSGLSPRSNTSPSPTPIQV